MATALRDNHTLKLRQKLEADPSRPVHFRTVHGAGWLSVGLTPKKAGAVFKRRAQTSDPNGGQRRCTRERPVMVSGIECGGPKAGGFGEVAAEPMGQKNTYQ